MEATHKAMKNVYEAKKVSLHVRWSNRAALGLYKYRLKYEQADIEAGYYADGEDAYYMVKHLVDGYNLGLDAEELAMIEDLAMTEDKKAEKIKPEETVIASK